MKVSSDGLSCKGEEWQGVGDEREQRDFLSKRPARERAMAGRSARSGGRVYGMKSGGGKDRKEANEWLRLDTVCTAATLRMQVTWSATRPSS